MGAPQRPVAPDDDEAFDTLLAEGANRPPAARLGAHLLAPGRTQHRPSLVEDRADVAGGQRRVAAVDESLVAVLERNGGDVTPGGGPHYGSDRSVHAGSVATRCEHTDAFHRLPPREGAMVPAATEGPRGLPGPLGRCPSTNIALWRGAAPRAYMHVVLEAW